jgi:CDP-diacylglycerol--glycerol-3-phosphate 3-phosphatidyltransferase
MFLNDLKHFLEKIDHYRDEFLFVFIKPYWPRKISPNQLTYVRIVIGIVLFILLFFFRIENKILIISLFCVGALTDLFDGSVARGLDMATEFGAMLDPIADRLLVLPIAIYSLYGSEKWLLLILLLTELINAITSVFYKSKEVYKANIFGKTRMLLLSFVFVAILIVWPNTPPEFFIDIVWISLIFSFLSIFTRIIELKNKGHIKNKIANKELNKYFKRQKDETKFKNI